MSLRKLQSDTLPPFLFAVLFVTDIWVVAFKGILYTLLRYFPVVYPKGFYEILYPKPYDIPLYMMLTIGGVLSLFFANKWLLPLLHKKYTTQKKTRVLLWIIIIILIFILCLFLGSYPLMGWAVSFKRALINALFIVLLGVVVIAEFVCYGLFKKRQWVYIGFTFLLIALLTYEPGFPIQWFDYGYIIGPAQEMLHGKTIYMQIPSQYGFLLEYVIAAIMKFSHLSLDLIPLFIWFLYIGAYGSLFFVMYKLTKSAKLSILFLFSLIAINYYSLLHVPILIEQIGPLRFLVLWFAPLIFYLTYFKKKYKYLGLGIMALLALWEVDAVILAIGAVASLEVFLAIKKVQTVQQAVLHSGFLLLSVAFFFLLISVGGTFIGYKLIDPLFMLQALHEYAGAGFYMLPIPPQTFFWLFIFVFFAAILYIIGKKKLEKADIMLGLGALLSFFASTYYMGRSHPHNLFHISVLMLFTLFLLFSRLQVTYQLLQGKRAILFACVGGFFLFIFLPLLLRQDAQASYLFTYEKQLQAHFILPHMQEFLESHYGSDAKFIQDNNPSPAALVISEDDTYFLMLSNKASAIQANPMGTIISQDNLARAFSQLKTCPVQIFVEKCIPENNCRTTRDPRHLGNFLDQDKVYEKIQAMCGQKYAVSSCSQNLCMMSLHKH